MCYLKARGVGKFGRRGFSLLEMVIVMLMLAVLAGIGFAGASYLWKGEKVETAARNMQSVMMRALRLSVANQKAYAVVVDATQVRLIDAAEVLLITNGGETSDVVSIEQSGISPGIQVYVRRWRQEEWTAVAEEIVEVLDFPVSGICEPVRFRLVDGEDVLEFSLHPLTAFPVDETLLVK